MSAPVIVDAGVGNLGNLVRALAHLGASPVVTRDPEEVAAARCLLLPGVGAFAPPREALRGALEEAIRQALAGGAWLLGICVGFQLLFEQGEEFGVTDGLGLLPGRVTRLPEGVSVPHIGWNRLVGQADHPLLEGVAETGRPGAHVYFVHSYAPEGVPAEVLLASAVHGREFAAVAGRGRVLGTQFHPERSGEAGLRLLGNFLAIVREEALTPSVPLSRTPSPRTGRGGGPPAHGRQSRPLRAGVPGADGSPSNLPPTETPGSWRGPSDRVPLSRRGRGDRGEGHGSDQGPAQDFALLPALDLLGGRAVRLSEGDRSRATDYGDPLEVLARYARAGVARVHVVDLDAAFGDPPQHELIARLAAAGGPALQLGGGLRSREAVLAALERGCERVVVGSMVARDPQGFSDLAHELPGRIVPALDVRDGRVRLAGWQETAGWTLEDLARGLRGLPCPAVLVTDVSRDGLMGGPNVELAQRVADLSGLPALVSGGVSSLADLSALVGVPGVAGAVVGRALFEGAFTVEEALAVVSGISALSTVSEGAGA